MLKKYLIPILLFCSCTSSFDESAKAVGEIIMDCYPESTILDRTIPFCTYEYWFEEYNLDLNQPPPVPPIDTSFVGINIFTELVDSALITAVEKEAGIAKFKDCIDAFQMLHFSPNQKTVTRAKNYSKKDRDPRFYLIFSSPIIISETKVLINVTNHAGWASRSDTKLFEKQHGVWKEIFSKNVWIA